MAPQLRLIKPIDFGLTCSAKNDSYLVNNTKLPIPPNTTVHKQGVPPIYFYDQSYILLAQNDDPPVKLPSPLHTCINLDWKLPDLVGKGFDNYILQNKNPLRETISQQAKVLPKDYKPLWELIKDKKQYGYKEFYKKLQEMIDQANKENKPLIVLVGDYHKSAALSSLFGKGVKAGSGSKQEFIPGFLASLTGITDIALEYIQSNPDQEIKIDDKLKEKLTKLITTVKTMQFKNKTEKDEKILSLIEKDEDLKIFFNGDLDNIVFKYFNAENKKDEEFYWDLINIFIMIFVNINDDVEKEILDNIKYAKEKGITVNGLNITGKDLSENYYARNYMAGMELYTKMLDVYMANNIERIICNRKKKGENPIIFAFVGRSHINKDNIPLYIRTKDAIVTSVFLDGGIEDQCNHLDLLLKKKGMSNKTFWVDLQGYKETDFILHIPAFEGSEKERCKSPLLLNH